MLVEFSLDLLSPALGFARGRHADFDPVRWIEKHVRNMERYDLRFERCT
jgi:hypothetical protein